MDLSSVSVVIPAKNEGATLEPLLDSMPANLGEIIVVDGVSSDHTFDIASSFGGNVRAIERSRIGKGNALACGIAAAAGTFVVCIDADGSASAADIPRLVSELENGVDFAKGFRRTSSSGIHQLGSFALTNYFNAVLSTSFSDVCCGTIAFRSDVADIFRLDPFRRSDHCGPNDGFEIDVVLLGEALRNDCSVREIAVSHAPRQGGSSKLQPVKDGLRIARAISKFTGLSQKRA